MLHTKTGSGCFDTLQRKQCLWQSCTPIGQSAKEAWFCHNNACQRTCSRHGVISYIWKLTQYFHKVNGISSSGKRCCYRTGYFVVSGGKNRMPYTAVGNVCQLANISKLIAAPSDIVKHLLEETAVDRQSGNAMVLFHWIMVVG